MEQKNRSHGKIDNLPPELKKEVDASRIAIHISIFPAKSR